MRLQSYLLSSVLLLLLPANIAAAQTSEETLSQEAIEQALNDLDEIVVVGSRLEGGALSAPVTTIDSFEIEARGITTVDALLRQLSVNTPNISGSNAGGLNGLTVGTNTRNFNNFSGGTVANLRGAGAGSTLVLLNGRRLAGEGVVNGEFTDISTIPVDSIERVEILTAGASAIYGADAVAGVINIVLKSGYEDTTVKLRAGLSASGGDEYRASATSGHSWGSGGVTFTGTYLRQDAVDARKFGITTRDYRPFGGTDQRELTSANGVFTNNGLNLDGRDQTDVFLANGYELPAGFGAVDFLTNPADLNIVSRDSLSEVLSETLSPESDAYGISARFNQDINLGIIESAYFDASYGLRDTVTESEPDILNISGVSLALAPSGIPFVDEDFFPRFDLNYSIDLRDLKDGILPTQSVETKSEDINLAGGLKGKFNDNWNWDASVSHTTNQDENLLSGSGNVDLVHEGLGEFNFDTFEFIEILPAFNLARNDFATNTDAQNALQLSFISGLEESKTSLTSLNGVVRGKLFDKRVAGPLDMAFGAEHRIETTRDKTTRTDEIGSRLRNPILNMERDVTALFGEANFPITAGLSVDAALRWEEVSNSANSLGFDSAVAAFRETGQRQSIGTLPLDDFIEQSDSGFSPRLGVSWTPNPYMHFVGSIGQSFRAPNAFEVAQPVTVDPASQMFFETFDPQTGDAIALDVPLVSGGNPDLKSEVADTVNFGFTFTPIQSDKAQFSFGADYFSLDYTDRIGAQPRITNDEGVISEEAIIRNPDGTIDYIFSGFINIGRQKTSGVDFKASHYFDFGSGNIQTDFRLSQLLENEFQVTPTSELVDSLGISSPETRWNLRSTVERGNATLTGVVTHTGSFTDDFSNEFFASREVDSLTLVDVVLGYRLDDKFGLAEGVRLELGVANLFDTEPSFQNLFNGFSSLGYDLRRRVISFEVAKTF